MLTRTQRLALIRKIEREAPAGQRRDFLKWKYLCGKGNFRRRSQFYEHCVSIPDKHSVPPGQARRFKMNRAQRDQERWRIYFERRGEPVRFATLKARQYGISTYWLVAAFELCSRHTNTLALIVPDETDTGANLLEKAKAIREHAPFPIPTRLDNRERLQFQAPINSAITIQSAQKKNPGRGKTYAMAHCTEPAFWRDPAPRVASLMQAVPSAPGTVLSWESTANGEGNWWHDFWWDAWQGRNDYKAFFYPWFYDPEFDYCHEIDEAQEEMILDTLSDEEAWILSMPYTDPGQIAWRRWALANLVPQKAEVSAEDWFNQEYPATPEQAFLASGKPGYSAHLIAFQNNRCVQEPMWKGDVMPGPLRDDDRFEYELSASDHGATWIWDRPRPHTIYAAGIDAGEGGDESDFSCCVILEAESGHQVAVIHGRIEPGHFGRMCACLCAYYNMAYVYPERKQAGIAVLQSMADYGYYMLGRAPTFGKGAGKREAKLGWDTNINTKQLMVLEGRRALNARGEFCAIRDDRLTAELRTIQRMSDGGYEAPQGRHDDYHDAWTIALWARRDVLDSGRVEEEKDTEPKSVEEAHWREYREEEAEGDRRAKLLLEGKIDPGGDMDPLEQEWEDYL